MSRAASWREVSGGCSGNKSVPGGGCLKEQWALEEGFVWALNKNWEGTCSWWLSPLARWYPRRKGSLKVPRMASEIRLADQCALGHTATSTKARQTCTSQKKLARYYDVFAQAPFIFTKKKKKTVGSGGRGLCMRPPKMKNTTWANPQLKKSLVSVHHASSLICA